MTYQDLLALRFDVFAFSYEDNDSDDWDNDGMYGEDDYDYDGEE